MSDSINLYCSKCGVEINPANIRTHKCEFEFERDRQAELYAQNQAEGLGYIAWHDRMEFEIATFKAGWDAAIAEYEASR